MNKNGEMYDWVDCTYNPLAGACSHQCSYCYVNALKKRSPVIMNKYSGEPRLDEGVLRKKIKPGTYFLCSCNDLFADNVTLDIIESVLRWASNQNCRWIIQSKNPFRIGSFTMQLPDASIIGTTIETNRDTREISKAPLPIFRARCLGHIPCNYKTFITIEPILQFDLEALLELIKRAEPDWVNIGADSKKSGLPEPTKEEIEALISGINSLGIPIRKKTNLDRILRGK